MNEILSIAALGEFTSLGCLYDSREQLFINDIRLFNFTKLPENTVQIVIPNGHSYYKLSKEDTYSKKFELMNISGDLAIKVACLPFFVKGSAKYLNEFKKSNNSIKWDLLYSRTTCNELIDLQGIYEYYKSNDLNLNESFFEGATHVVTGISWGSNAVLSIEYENKKNESAHLIESLLSLKFEYLNIGLSASNTISNNHNNENLSENFKCEIKADISDLETVCTNLEQAFEMFKNLPDKVKQYNNGKGTQIEFHLSSLNKIRKIFQMNIKCEIIRNLESDFYDRITNLFQEIILIKQKYSADIVQDLEQREISLKSKIYKEIINFKKGVNGSSLQTIQNIFRDLEQLKDNYVEAYLKTNKKSYLDIMKYYDEIISLNPNNSKIYCKKAILLSKLNKHKETILCCNKALKLDSNLPEASIIKANSLFRLSKYLEAISVLDNVSKDFNLTQVYFIKGKCFKSISNYQNSIEYFSKVIELDPNHIGAYVYKALSLQSLNQKEEATKLFLKANEMISHEKNLENLLYKGLILTNLGKYDEAILSYDKLIESDSNDLNLTCDALNNKGISLSYLKKYDDSIKCYEKAICLDESFAYAFNNLALSFHKINETNQALECINKSLELDASCAFAYNNKGIFLNYLKKTKEAIECFKKSTELDPISFYAKI